MKNPGQGTSPASLVRAGRPEAPSRGEGGAGALRQFGGARARPDPVAKAIPGARPGSRRSRPATRSYRRWTERATTSRRGRATGGDRCGGDVPDERRLEARASRRWRADGEFGEAATESGTCGPDAPGRWQPASLHHHTTAAAPEWSRPRQARCWRSPSPASWRRVRRMARSQARRSAPPGAGAAAGRGEDPARRVAHHAVLIDSAALGAERSSVVAQPLAQQHASSRRS